MTTPLFCNELYLIKYAINLTCLNGNVSAEIAFSMSVPMHFLYFKVLTSDIPVTEHLTIRLVPAKHRKKLQDFDPMALYR